MGVNIYKCNYRFVWGQLTDEEINFIAQYFSEQDGSRFIVNKEELKRVIEIAKDDDEPIPKELIKKLRNAVGNSKYGSFDFVLA